MGLIALEGMQFYAYHGVYEEEQIIGNHFVVDVYIETLYDKAAMTDDLFNTINYELVYLICQAEMRKKYKLLEKLAVEIVNRLKQQFNNIHEVKVRITKKNPLPAARAAQAVIELEDDFLQKCPRCGRPFICYKDGSCWCHELRVHPKTRESIQQEFRGCLCRDCLSFYAG